MTTRTLQLFFGPNVLVEPNVSVEPKADTDVVLCGPSTPASVPGVFSTREFLKEDYERKGRELCLWWYRQFSTRDAEGESLHDLFAWDGCSALWFSHALFLYPEWGPFLKLMVAVRTLELLREGKYSEVHVIGLEPTLAKVFSANGFQVGSPDARSNVIPASPTVIPASSTVIPAPSTVIPVSSTVIPANAGIQGSSRSAPGLAPLQRFHKALKTFRYLYRDPQRYRRQFPDRHAPNQTDTLFYYVQFGEWELPGSGQHRYLHETVEEMLGAGVAAKARPFIFGRPTIGGDSAAWEEFVRYSIVDKEALYPMVFNTPSLGRRIYRWTREIRPKVEQWLERNRTKAFQWGGFDLTALAYPLVRGSIEDAARKILIYEVNKKALLVARPKAIVMKDEAYPDGRSLIAAARKASVRTVAFQHGSIYPTHWCYTMDPESEGIGRPPLPDAFGVYGSEVARLLVEKGGFPESIFRVTGARRFRSLNDARPAPEIEKIAAQGQPVVLVAGQLHLDMPRIYDWMFRIAEETKEAVFIFKPHPRDRDGAALEARCRRLENAYYYEGPLREILPAATLTVSGHSTVLLESVWLGIGALSVQISGEEPADWLREAGLIAIVHTYEELKEAVRRGAERTLYDEEDRSKAAEYLENYLGFSACSDTEALSRLL
jgi:hypothetical protein